MVFVSNKGKDAITRYRPIKKVGNFTLLEVQLLTGRTHQIRVHLASISHPVIGDNKYGDFELNKEIENNYHFKNQFLISYDILFGKLDDPIKYLSGREFKIELPQELNELIKKIEGRIK